MNFDAPWHFWHRGRVVEQKVSHHPDPNELSVAVAQLAEEVRILRTAVDELRDDVVWAARQVLTAGYEVTGESPPPPYDPLAPDADCEPYQTDDPAEASDEEMYCCNSPSLTWHGPPDLPGIACGNCGFVVAQEGNIEIWREESNSTATEVAPPSEPQGLLFE